MRDFTINLPLYDDVKEMYIGMSCDAVLQEAIPYFNNITIVYCGYSITQGGCASRPRMSYPNIISHKYNIDYINLEFSDNAKAENKMIEYIKELNISLFVYDYDYNAPTTEHLKNTHEKNV